MTQHRTVKRNCSSSSVAFFCCHCAVAHPFSPSLPVRPLASSSFISACRFLLFFFSPLHTASQKHSLKAMHESNLANFKWSKV